MEIKITPDKLEENILENLEEEIGKSRSDIIKLALYELNRKLSDDNAEKSVLQIPQIPWIPFNPQKPAPNPRQPFKPNPCIDQLNPNDPYGPNAMDWRVTTTSSKIEMNSPAVQVEELDLKQGHPDHNNIRASANFKDFTLGNNTIC